MKTAKILIVEDEAIIAMDIKSKLKGMGYHVTAVVSDGENAISRAETDKPDIILMDIRIKGEMDGIMAADVIRQRFNIPIIFSTAYLDRQRIEQAKITMPFGYLLKPIQDRDLKVTIEMALYVNEVDKKRRQAEQELQKAHAELEQKALELAMINMDLQVHQTELEHQNEELKRTQSHHAELQTRYFQLYDFAPVGYMILNEKGVITESNLTCATMLGVDKTHLKNLGFSNFIASGSQNDFYFHRQKVVETREQQTCELQLVRKDKTEFSARLESRARFNAQGEFIQLDINIIDIV